MRPARHLLEEIHKRGMTFHCLHRFPYVFLMVVDPSFKSLGDEERLGQFSKALGWTKEEIETTALHANLEVQLLTELEYQERYPVPGERGQSWLREVVEGLVTDALPARSAPSPQILTLHFYGYKGGQARSTCLGYLAQALANDRWRVLVIDGDIEAPSLDVLFGQRALAPESTLVGINAGTDIHPRRVFDPDVGSGCVDLIACRPDGRDYQMEAIALAMGFAMDPTQIGRCLQRIIRYATETRYDVLLVDHRAGLSPFAVPWMEALPGQLVLFARLDDQWRAARDYLPALLRRSTEPAVFVAFRADGESSESFLERTKPQVDDLLTELAMVLNQRTSPPGDQSSVELRPQFLLWPFDPAFRQTRLPDPTRTTGDLRDVTYELRRLTGVEGQRSQPGLSLSGAQDRGDFVQTAVWRDLLRPENPIRYIFGRKGTGKTRLLSEMQRQRLGEPLLVDRLDDSSYGIKAGSRVLNVAIERFALGPEAFFWMLFGCALELPDTSRASLESRVLTALDKGNDLALHAERLRQSLGGKPRRTFLIDGLESAFPNDKVSRFIEALFRVLWAFQSERLIQSQIEFRVFLRTDLASFGIQNREQQTEGQTVHLRWGYQSILNFALLRMLATEPDHARYYAVRWPEPIRVIRAQREALGRGALSIEAAEELLLSIFPKRIARDNTLTTNFLRTYFTDSDAPILSRSTTAREGDATYYPRVFDAFLTAIARDAQKDPEGSIKDGRLDSDLLERAHEEAALLFLDQIRQELDFRIVLTADEEQNRHHIRRMLQAFHGEATPFVPSDLAKRIASKFGDDIPTPRIIAALDQMREIGMFEARPGHAFEWQVGRLFKSSLQMRNQT